MKPLFLRRIDKQKNIQHFYLFDMQPYIFGCVMLIKEWGRIGKRGRMVGESHDNEASASKAMKKQS